MDDPREARAPRSEFETARFFGAWRRNTFGNSQGSTKGDAQFTNNGFSNLPFVVMHHNAQVTTVYNHLLDCLVVTGWLLNATPSKSQHHLFNAKRHRQAYIMGKACSLANHASPPPPQAFHTSSPRVFKTQVSQSTFSFILVHHVFRLTFQFKDNKEKVICQRPLSGLIFLCSINL